MFTFSYQNEQLQLILSDRRAFWDTQVEEELTPALKQLKKTGEIAGATCGQKPGVTGFVYELKGTSFLLTYTVDSGKKEVKFYEFKQISHSIDWKTAFENDLDGDISEPCYIPQIGDPRKYLKALDLINTGINTPKDLGKAFGSNAKDYKGLARRGYYFGRPLEELGLVMRVQREKKSCIYELTEKGLRISNNPDREFRERLITESLLGFRPIQMILEKTYKDHLELSKELVEQVILELSQDECGGTTAPRRAGSLRELVNWVSRWAGIPICRQGAGGAQLFIPYIYANS